MYNSILNILVFASLGVIIYLIARSVPRVKDEEMPPRGPNFVDKLLKKVPTGKIDETINSSMTKFLRKLRVLILKVDNFINHRLGKLKKPTPGNNDENQLK